MKRICPKCGREYDESPAISRDDNVTEICGECGMNEALKAFFQYGNGVRRMDKIINDITESVMKTAELSVFVVQEIEEMNLGSTAIEAFIYSLALTLHKEYHEVDIKRVGLMLYTGGEDDEKSV